MSLSAGLHRLAQIERELRRELEPRQDGWKGLLFDPERATLDELAELDVILEAGFDRGFEAGDPQLERLYALVEEINARTEPPPVTRHGSVSPEERPRLAVDRETVEDVREARESGGVVLPVADGVHVRLAFDPANLADPEPENVEEPEPFDEAPVDVELAADVEAEAELIASPEPEPAPRREPQFAPAAFTWRSEASRPAPGTAGELMEREF